MHPWYTHYDPGVPKEAPRPWLLTDLLRENARRYAHKVALESWGEVLATKACGSRWRPSPKAFRRLA